MTLPHRRRPGFVLWLVGLLGLTVIATVVHGAAPPVGIRGKGGFAPGPKLQAAEGAGYVTAADLNADGIVDLITGNYQAGSVSVFIGRTP